MRLINAYIVSCIIQQLIDQSLTQTLLLLFTVFAPAPTNFRVNSSLSSLTSIVLQWDIPFEQVPPDRFLLEYNLTKLSGEAASRTQFSVNLSDSTYSYTVQNPLSYTDYEFRLFAFYGDDRSDVVTTSYQTPQASELRFLFTVYHSSGIIC